MKHEDVLLLEDLGFTRAESVTYLSLLSLGPSKVGKIIEKSGLQSSTIHNTLRNLQEKGYISFIVQDSVKIYQASSPVLLKQQLEVKMSSLIDVLPRLEAEQNFHAAETTTEIFVGKKGIFSMMLSLLEDAKPGDMHWFFATVMEGRDEEIQEFFGKYQIHRLEQQLDVRGVVPLQQREFFVKRKMNVRYFDFPIPGNINLSKDKMTIITWGEKPTGVLIKSQPLVNQQKAFFEQLWKMGKR